MTIIRHIFCLLIVASTVACSPQKRLAYLLTMHPELHQEVKKEISRTVLVKEDSANIIFNIAELNGIASETGLPEQSRTRNNDLTVSTMSGATATITATDVKDTYKLQVKTNPDTITITDTITIPAYTTRIQYEDKIVNTMNSRQTFFFWIGVIVSIITCIVITIKITSLFLKP